MSVDANSVIDDITNGQIPNLWLLKSYPSLKSLGGYIDDFLHRLEFIQVSQYIGIVFANNPTLSN